MSPRSPQAPQSSQQHDSCWEPARPRARPTPPRTGPHPAGSSHLPEPWGPPLGGGPWSVPFTLLLVQLTENTPLRLTRLPNLCPKGVSRESPHPSIKGLEVVRSGPPHRRGGGARGGARPPTCRGRRWVTAGDPAPSHTEAAF